MVRVAMVVLGALLLGPGTLGIGGEGSTWIRFFDIGFALAAALTAFQLPRQETEVIRIGLPALFAGGLFVLWLFALAAGAPAWQTWSNFGIAFGFALLAFAEKLNTREDEPAQVLPWRKRA